MYSRKKERGDTVNPKSKFQNLKFMIGFQSIVTELYFDNHYKAVSPPYPCRSSGVYIIWPMRKPVPRWIGPHLESDAGAQAL
jgi:hypothetical protein